MNLQSASFNITRIARRCIKKIISIKESKNNSDALPSNMKYVKVVYEEEIYKKISNENTNAFSVAGELLNYSLYSLRQKMKAKNADEYMREVYMKGIDKYNDKIYSTAKTRFINKPISKYV